MRILRTFEPVPGEEMAPVLKERGFEIGKIRTEKRERLAEGWKEWLTRDTLFHVQPFSGWKNWQRI